jgi:2-oxoglutarate ferredoxin oxidoreductase subunit delta
MTAKVVIRDERCKGCGLCVAACPKKILGLADRTNDKGYNPAECKDLSACISCAACARTCPDLAIAIYK